MKLQEQLSNGEWVDCGDRTEYFLNRCAKTNGLTRDEVIVALGAGRTIRNDVADWYSNCRDQDAIERIRTARRAAAPATMVRCACGHSVPSVMVMTTTNGTSCPDCYYKMSA